MARVVLITGCSSGIGMETALAFSRAGDIVYASMRDTSKAAGLNAIATKEKLPLTAVTLDVTQPESFAGLVSDIVEKDGRLDVLVNNAGVLPIGAFEDTSEAQIRQTMEVNFIGPALLSQAVLPVMRAQKSGYVIMISSLSGMASKSGDAVYAASKFALEGLTEGFRNEVAHWNIKTALVEPGQYATSIFQGVKQAEETPDSAYGSLNKFLRDEVSSDTPQGLPPERLARLLVEISHSDGSRLRWAADETAERVMSAVFAQSDDERGAFLRDVGGIDWWIEGKDAPEAGDGQGKEG